MTNTYCVVLRRLVWPVSPASLDCPFLIGRRYSLTFIHKTSSDVVIQNISKYHYIKFLRTLLELFCGYWFDVFYKP